MQVNVHLKEGPIHVFEDVEGIMAANDVFPYWLVRSNEDDEGYIKADFFAEDTVSRVHLRGKANEDERHLASVTSIKPEYEEYFGGDNNRPIS